MVKKHQDFIDIYRDQPVRAAAEEAHVRLRARRRNKDMAFIQDNALTASVDHSHAHPADVWPTIRRHAQEMEDDVMRQHIALYVNDFTRDYGAEGEAAIRQLLETAERLAIVPHSDQPIFA